MTVAVSSSVVFHFMWYQGGGEVQHLGKTCITKIQFVLSALLNKWPNLRPVHGLKTHQTLRSKQWNRAQITTKWSSSPCLNSYMRRGTSPPPSSTPYPPLPSRLVRSTSAAWLSHADVISGPTSEAYGNVTGRRWTRWVLTPSSPPTGRTLFCTSPRLQRQVWVKQEAGQADKRSLTLVHSQISSISVVLLF